MPDNLTQLIFGRLSWEAIPLHEPILIATFAGVVLGGIGLLGLITYFKLWGTLWHDWFTSIDHKKIGIMYMVPIFLWSMLVNQSRHSVPHSLK